MRIEGSLPIFFKFLRYSLVGVTSGLIYLFFTHILVLYIGMFPRNATLLGYFVLIPFNFIANRRFAFRSAASVAPEISRFLFLHATGLSIAYMMMIVFVDTLGWSHLIPATFTIIVVPFVNFVVLNIWVFAKKA